MLDAREAIKSDYRLSLMVVRRQESNQ